MPEIIRRAGPADAEILADLGRRTFSQTFGALYPPEDLAAFLGEAHGLARAHRDLADPDSAVWLAEEDGAAIGYVLAGRCALPHAEVSPECGEIKRLYLLATHQSGGRGGRLMQQAISWLERDGPRRIWVGVWSGNLGAQRFYARHGFEAVGAYEFPVGRARDLEYIMRRPPHDFSTGGAR